RTIRPPSGSRITCLGFITTLSRQTHRTARNHGGNGMLVDHLADGVLQQDDELVRSEEHTSELQSRENLVCRLLLEKKKNKELQQQDNHEYPFLYQRQTCHQVQPNRATYKKRPTCQHQTYLQHVS